ncbi:tRNA (guanine(26)-N(2))-dimethyltransferase-like [Oscarella lobularis]|uniref:tRNA (guanine(26)-N(2))-dimethyltransferase-like n=1 Tax=Oscarella lobularis TaxID=121494 RepID=UPI0033136147
MTESDAESYRRVSEGKATILYPRNEEVFYNPVQEFNRDLSTAVIREFIGEKSNVSILEALAASGLRSIRYALEIPRGLSRIVANDLSPAAVESIKRNVEHNQVNHIVTPTCTDASLLMYQHRVKKFDVIDLDPYGSPSPFLDSAVQAVSDGGLLCVTCTDMGVLCGSNSEASYAKYGSVSLKASYCHEMALRIALASIESHCARYKRYIRPLLSVSVDFYIRVFVQVFTGAVHVKDSASKKAYVYRCIGCDSFHLQNVGKRVEKEKSIKYSPGTGPPIIGQHCDECGSVFQVGGPVWAKPIHDIDFVKKLLAHVSDAETAKYGTVDRMRGTLSVISEELPDYPFYYCVDKMCGFVHCTTPPLLSFKSALMSLGHQVSFTHCRQNAFKTSASNKVLWDVLRSWIKSNPVNMKKVSEKSPTAVFLSKESSLEVDFTVRPDANPPSRQKKLLRFQENPLPNWGPKSRAKKRKENSETLTNKRKRLQGRTKSENAEKRIEHKCKNFLKGTCRYEDKCRYSHDPSSPKQDM